MRGVFVVYILSFVGCITGDILPWTGVNGAAGEFAPNLIPGNYAKDYTYPSTDEADYWIRKGSNIFRLPFLWERAQPTLNGSLSTLEFTFIDQFVGHTTAAGAYVIMDPHNYARYSNQIIGVNITSGAFANFWFQMAQQYKSNPLVIFGLMNEPNTMPSSVWVQAAQDAINAIRSTGATNPILVPGNYWTGAWSWTTRNDQGATNADAMVGITDPGNNIFIEVHQYLDNDSSGSGPLCNSSTIGSERLTAFTNWCRANHWKAFLGEFAGGPNQQCADAVTDMLNYMEANADVWVGWTWWAAGPWWGDYFFSIEPTNNLKDDAPMLTILAPHLHPASSSQLKISGVMFLAILAAIFVM